MMFFVLFLPIFSQNLVAAEGVQDTSEIIAGLKDLNNDVISLTKQTKDLEASLPKLTLEISEAIQMDPLVTLQKEALDSAINNGEPVHECKKILREKYPLVVDKVHGYVSDKISKRLKNLQNDLKIIQKETNESINLLNSNDISPRKMIEIIDKSDDNSLVIERIKHVLQNLVTNALYDLDQEPTASVVKDGLLKPLHECLENSKVTERKGK